MNCKKCGAQLTPEDQFCKNCGAAVENENAQNTQPTPNVQPTPSVNNVQNNGMSDYAIPQQPVNNMNMNYGTNIPVNNGNGSYNNPNNGMPYQQTYSQNNIQPKKNNNLIFIIIGVVVVIAIVAVIAFAIINSGSNGNNNGGNSSGNNGVNIGGDNTTPVVNPNSSAYKVHFDDFTFNVPSNMMYETSTEALMIGDENGTWAAEIYIADGSYNQLKNNRSQLQAYFQQNGFTSKPAEVKTLKGTEYITIEMAMSGVNFVGGYAKLNSMKTAWIVTYNQDNKFDYSILEKMSSIISSVQYNQSSSHMEAGKFKFNMNEMSKFAQ